MPGRLDGFIGLRLLHVLMLVDGRCIAFPFRLARHVTRLVHRRSATVAAVEPSTRPSKLPPPRFQWTQDSTTFRRVVEGQRGPVGDGDLAVADSQTNDSIQLYQLAVVAPLPRVPPLSLQWPAASGF